MFLIGLSFLTSYFMVVIGLPSFLHFSKKTVLVFVKSMCDQMAYGLHFSIDFDLLT